MDFSPMGNVCPDGENRLQGKYESPFPLCREAFFDLMTLTMKKNIGS
jgi:hypothetical protein